MDLTEKIDIMLEVKYGFGDPADKIDLGEKHYVMTTVSKTLTGNNKAVISIQHRGNMGTSLKDISNNLKKMYGVGIEYFDKLPHKLSDDVDGSPDYLYNRKIVYRLRNV